MNWLSGKILCQSQIPLRGKLMLLFTPWRKTSLLPLTTVCILQILPNNTTSVLLVSLHGVNGNKTLQQEHQLTIQMTVCLRHFWFVVLYLHKRCVHIYAWWNAKLQQVYYPIHCNSIVWAHCPQHKHHGTKVIYCAVAPAVCHFHSGAASRLRVMERLLIPARMCTKKASAKKDKRRLKKSDLQVSAKEKKECSCCKPSEKRPWGRLRVIHMMEGAF